MKVYIVAYNGHISSEGYDDLDAAIGFITSRHGIETFKAITPMHYSSGKDSYKVHEVSIKTC